MQLSCGDICSNHFIRKFSTYYAGEKKENRSVFSDDGQKFAAYFLEPPCMLMQAVLIFSKG